MHRMQGTPRNRKMLQRTVKLLLSLADLAERAEDRSAVLRRLVLWILYRAESVARRFVVECCGPLDLVSPRHALSNDSREDALRLANCLRVLAYILDLLDDEDVAAPDLMCPFGSRASRPRAHLKPRGDCNRARLYPDTS